MHKAAPTNSSNRIFRLCVLITLGVMLAVRLAAMFAAPLMDTTEARYGEISRIMAELNDWITPWFDYGVPFWGKPPFTFWITAASFELFGVNEFAARLPHLLLALAIVGLGAWMARRRDPESVLPVVVLIFGTPIFFVLSGAVTMDIALTFGTTLAMAGFWFALEAQSASEAERRPGGFERWLPSLLFFGGLVVGALAKGPVAVVLTGFPLFLWTAFNSRWRDVWRALPWITGGLLAMLLTLAWYIAAERKTPGFLEYFLLGEHFQRFVTPNWQGDKYGEAHGSPIGMILLFGFAGLLPWTVMLPIEAFRWRKPATDRVADSPADKPWRSYLFVWLLSPLLLYAPARNAGWAYVLPGLPAAAILAGQWLAVQARRGHNINRTLLVGMLLSLATMFAAAFAWSQPGLQHERTALALLAAYDKSMAERGFVPVPAPVPAPAPAPAPAQADSKPGKPAVPLIFVRRRPFSAQFYTRGQAILVPDVHSAWLRIGDGGAYVATRYPELFLAVDLAAKRKIHRLGGAYGRFYLFFVEPR